jgi:hypothetical protein
MNNWAFLLKHATVTVVTSTESLVRQQQRFSWIVQPATEPIPSESETVLTTTICAKVAGCHQMGGLNILCKAIFVHHFVDSGGE